MKEMVNTPCFLMCVIYGHEIKHVIYIYIYVCVCVCVLYTKLPLCCVEVRGFLVM